MFSCRAEGLVFLLFFIFSSSLTGRELSVNRAYTDGGNSDFVLPNRGRRVLRADVELDVLVPTSEGIQSTLDEARILAANHPGATIVVRLDPTVEYSLDAPIFIHRNTVLEGSGAKITVALNGNETLANAITLVGAKSGIHSTKIYSNGRTKRATIHVAAETYGCSVFDNVVDGGVLTNVGPSLLDVDKDVSNLEVDGNTFRSGVTAISLRKSGLVGIKIHHNLFQDWYDRVIYVTNLSYDKPATDISIFCNRMEAPNEIGIVRQPIAFQSISPGNARIQRVTIHHNWLTGNGEPYVVGPLSRFSSDEEIERYGQTNKYRLLNGATADMISLHDVADFDIVANHVQHGGEVGINVSRGNCMGRVRGNYVLRTDTVGINIGTPLADEDIANPLRPTGIEVFNNTIVEAGRDRAEEVDYDEQWWARSGIAVTSASFVSLRHNNVIENSFPRDAVLDYGVYSRDTSDLTINAASFRFSNYAGVWSPVDLGDGILGFRVIGDATLDGVVDLDDVKVLIDSWYQDGDWSDGDFTGDGFVDLDDFDLLLMANLKRRDRRKAYRRQRRAERRRIRRN